MCIMEKKLYPTIRTIQTGKHWPMPTSLYIHTIFQLSFTYVQEKKNSMVEATIQTVYI